MKSLISQDLKKNMNSKKNKLLLISAVCPFPMESGGAVRAYHTLKELSKYFEIYYIYFVPSQTTLAKKDRMLIDSFAYKSYECQMYYKKTHSFFIDNLIPYWFSDWYLPELSLLISRIIHTHTISKVHIDFSQIFYLIRYIPKTVYVSAGAIDISTVSFWRRLLANRNIFYFIDHLFKLIQIYLYERKYIKLANLVTVMSEEDDIFLHKIFPDTSIQSLVVRNGLDILLDASHSKNASTQKKAPKNVPIALGFIGSFNHPPNREGVKYILYKIIPELKKRGIPYSLFIAGNTHKGEFTQLLYQSGQLRNNHIHFLGYVKNVDTFYEQIDVLVAPIFSGSGTRIKILESLGRGIPVISSSIGAEGVSITSPYLTIRNTADEMIDRIDELRDKNLIKKEDYMELVEQMRTYTWTHIFKEYAKELEKRD